MIWPAHLGQLVGFHLEDLQKLWNKKNSKSVIPLEGGGVWTIISYSTSVLIAHLFFPPFPLIPFLWPLYPSCNISSKNIPPVFCCAFHVYGKPTNFDLKFNESLLHWKNFQTITSSSTSSKVLQATFVVAKSRTQALVGHTKCMQEKHAYLVPFYPTKKRKKKRLCTLTKIFSLFHMEMDSTTATHNEPDSRVSFVPQTPLAANLVQ